ASAPGRPAAAACPADPAPPARAAAAARASSRLDSVAVGSAMIAGLASASTTRRPAGPACVMITALGGSCCSSCCSTRNSRDRCAAAARDVLADSARDVLTPQDVLELMPSVSETESELAREKLWSLLAVPVESANGANAPCRLRPRPVLAPAVSLTDAESDTESAVPTVLV